ncbi:hypothetical protein [Synoicihabitans lomoniglobus]|uniref:Nucleotide-diphospho-sugar transferase n=1 Tax=Synoicihabitans lomoniglobus TaxID=2909285 RepID=A0AAF0CSJ5_9BACT|nr:glycosyltransferase [Opitutaceae bacterium LMO-M01]WED67328.1 putative nucleotide-diphospho-sugar transferase [Opitutaceae bacterium LMO-M01]
MPTRVAVYVATTPRHLAEAEASVTSLRPHLPGIPVTLFTQLTPRLDLFDTVVPLAKTLGASADKIERLLGLEASEILFLDTDTYVCGLLTPGFDLLARFDLAVARAAITATYEVPPPGDAFPEFNTGVLFLRNSSRLHAFLHRWLKLHAQLRDRDPHRVYDQPAFRQALWESELSVHTLPPEYNCRFIFPGFASGPVRVLHGRAPHLPAIAEELNRHPGKRVHTWHDGHLHVYPELAPLPPLWIRLGRRLGLRD